MGDDVGDATNLTPIRRRMVDLARSYEGATQDDPRYLTLIAGAWETAARREEMGGMSGCALTELGLWRMLGLEHELLSRAYVNGKAVEWAFKVARDKGAMREGPFELSDFQAGNAVVLEGDKPSVHVYTVVDPQPVSVGLAVALSLDGGQRVGDARREGDLMVKRTLLVVPRSTTWDTRVDPPPKLVRRVTHVVDLDALFAAA